MHSESLVDSLNPSMADSLGRVGGWLDLFQALGGASSRDWTGLDWTCFMEVSIGKTWQGVKMVLSPSAIEDVPEVAVVGAHVQHRVPGAGGQARKQ